MTSTEIKKMSTIERLRTMEALWDALCNEEDEIKSPSWHGNILEDRKKKIENGEAEFIAIEELKCFLTTEYNNEYWTDNDDDDLSKLIAGGFTGDFKNAKKYTCPCCGYKTLAGSGNYDLCPICYWEDDSLPCI